MDGEPGEHLLLPFPALGAAGLWEIAQRLLQGAACVREGESVPVDRTGAAGGPAAPTPRVAAADERDGVARRTRGSADRADGGVAARRSAGAVGKRRRNRGAGDDRQ